MTIFVCERCRHEIDLDEDVKKLIECNKCGEIMTEKDDELLNRMFDVKRQEKDMNRIYADKGEDNYGIY